MKKLMALFLLSSLSLAGTVTVDSSIQYQRMLGWGGVAQAGQSLYGSHLWLDEVLDRSVNELGLNYVRLRVHGSSEVSSNDNSDPFIINPSGFDFSAVDSQIEKVVNPMRALIEANGEKLFVNLLYGYNGLYIHYNKPEEYAEFMQAVFQHMDQKYGWVPNQVEIVNEPSGKGWNPLHVANALVATSKRLTPLGYSPSYAAPSNLNLRNAYLWFDQMVNSVPEVLNHIDELAYHRYGGDSEPDITQIGVRVQTYGVRSMMNERIGARHHHLYQDITLGLASSWQQFTIAFPGSDNGGAYYPIDVSDPNNPVVNMGERTGWLRQYFLKIRRGAVRVHATSDNSVDFNPLAFINTDGTYVVVVETNANSTITIAGVPDVEYGAYYNSFAAQHKGVELTVNNRTATIPINGLITFYGKDGGTVPPDPPDPPDPPVDITPPTLVLTGPTTAIRKTIVFINADATDNVGVTNIAWTGCFPTEDATSCELSLGGSPRKKYVITATAFDAAGNNSTAVFEVQATKE
jgi:hypothetical protein